MEEIEPAALLDHCDDLFLRYRMDVGSLRRAWVHGGAFAAVEWRPRFGEVLTVMGPPEVAGQLLAVLLDELEVGRVRLDADIELPDHRGICSGALWDWMLTDRRVPEPVAVEVLDVVRDAPLIDELLDAANPDAHGRPDDPMVPTWAGVRDGDGLVAAGALEWTGPGRGSGHLRAVTTRPDARGRGLGAAVSARLTNLALDGPAGVASLGVFCDNHVARRIYERLGYHRDRTVRAGTVEQPGRAAARRSPGKGLDSPFPRPC